MPGRGVGSPSWAQDTGPRWGEKELRGHLPCSRGLLRGLPWGALDTCSEVLRCPPSSVHSVADYRRAQPGVAVEDRGSPERLLRRGFSGPTQALPGTVCLAPPLRTKLLLLSPATQTDGGALELLRTTAPGLPRAEVQIKVQHQQLPGMVPDTAVRYTRIEHAY